MLLSATLIFLAVPTQAFAYVNDLANQPVDNTIEQNKLSTEDIANKGAEQQKKDDATLEKETKKAIEEAQKEGDSAKKKDTENNQTKKESADNQSSQDSLGLYAELPAISNDIQKDLPAGQYYISTSYAPGMVLDVAGGSNSDGANVQIYETNSTNAQK